MAEEDEWTRAEWEDYVRTRYKLLLAAKFAAAGATYYSASTQISTVVTDKGNAASAYWCLCDDSSRRGSYSIKDNYINDARYVLDGARLSRSAAILEDTDADSDYDVVVFDYTVDALQINPSSDYNNRAIELVNPNGSDFGAGVVYGSYAPCTYLKSNYPGTCGYPEADPSSCEGAGLRPGSCNSNYATYVFPSTEFDGSVVITKHPHYVRYSTTNTYSINEAYIVIGNPIIPDTPDDPDDPEEPIPPGEYRELSYLSLSTTQAILTDVYLLSGATEVSCDFLMDFEDASTYSPELSYPILNCPVVYAITGCSVMYSYSTPPGIAVGMRYTNYELNTNAILDLSAPKGCAIGKDYIPLPTGISGRHNVRIDLSSVEGESALHLDDYDHVLSGTFGGFISTPLAIGGYVCGHEGNLRPGEDCVGIRKIYSVDVIQGSSLTKLQPVMDSDGREGLRNMRSGRIFYPMAPIGQGDGYSLDCIILDSTTNIGLGVQVKSDSRIAITFNVLGSTQGIASLLNIPGTVGGVATSVEATISTVTPGNGDPYRILEVTAYGTYTLRFAFKSLPIDETEHTFIIDFDTGDVILDAEVIGNTSEAESHVSLAWDYPLNSEYSIRVGGAAQNSSLGKAYWGVMSIEASNVSSATDSGYTAVTRCYYLPVLNSSYVACLEQSTSQWLTWLSNPKYAMDAVPGYRRRNAGLYRLPGSYS